MDLNHARLPIPPRWQVDFHCSGDPSSPCQEDLPLYSTDAPPPVKPPEPSFPSGYEACPERSRRVPHRVNALAVRKPIYSSFAVIVIFAFSTFEPGHPFSAASAYF